MFNLVEGQFVGMSFEAICKELDTLEIEYSATPSDEIELAGIYIGYEYDNQFIIDFDDNDICDCSYYSNCDEWDY